MLSLLPASEQKKTSKQDLINLEEQILITLNFALHNAGPIPFIERFQRLFGMDQESVDHDFKQVGFTARQFVKYMMRYGKFLNWKPSQQAAAAFILSINLNLSSIGPSVGLRAFRGKQVQQLVQGALPVNFMAELTGAFQHTISPRSQPVNGPLGIWTEKVAELTGLDRIEDIASAYIALMEHLDTQQFKGQMKNDQKLWIKSTVSQDQIIVTDVSDSSTSSNSMDTEKMIQEELCQ